MWRKLLGSTRCWHWRWRGGDCGTGGWSFGMAGIAMLLTTHINIATFAQNEQGQTGKRYKTYGNFPHTISFIKKAPHQGSLKTPQSFKDRGR
jgi:hypothetical protein